MDPTLKLTLARDLPRGFGLSGNLNLSSLTEGHARFTQGAWSTSLGHDVGAGWGAYWEVYGLSAVDRDGRSAWTATTGLSHLLGPDRQFDLSGGRGLTGAAPDWFVSAGFSLRGALRKRS